MNIAMRLQNGMEGALNLLRRQPLVAGVAVFLTGVHFGFRLGLWPLAAAGGVVCGVFLSRGNAGLRWVGKAGLVFFLGWARSGWEAEGRSAEADRLTAAGTRLSFICGVGPEVAQAAGRGKAARYSFCAERVRIVEGMTSAPLRFLPVDVNWYGGQQAESGKVPRPGEVWCITGRPKVRVGRDGLRSVTISTGEDRSARLAEADDGSWLVRLALARREASRRVTIGIEDWDVSPLSASADVDDFHVSLSDKPVVPVLNQAMMLGCRGEIPAEMRRVFRDSGTIHVFAISGLNIALVAGLLIVVVSGLGVPRPYWVLGVAPLLVFYTFASGVQPSAVRACIMAIIYFAAPLFGRRPNGLTALSATALLVYAWAPSLLYNIGCTLSFAVMGGLVLFCRPFCHAGRHFLRLSQWSERARLYENAGSRFAAWRVRAGIWAARIAIDSVAVSLAAWLASLPLSAYYFGRFTPGGFLANLVIAPCAFLVMVAGCLGLVASMFSSWAASCFNHAAGLFTVIMIRTAEVTVGFRWSNFRVERWEPWMVWGWFLLLAAGALWMHVRRPDGLAWLEGGAEEKDIL